MTNQITPMEALERAIVAVNGQSELARELEARTGKKIRQGTIWAWLHRHHRVPPEMAPYIEIIAVEKGENVTREQLCPDFPWTVKSATSRASA